MQVKLEISISRVIYEDDRTTSNYQINIFVRNDPGYSGEWRKIGSYTDIHQCMNDLIRLGENIVEAYKQLLELDSIELAGKIRKIGEERSKSNEKESIHTD